MSSIDNVINAFKQPQASGNVPFKGVNGDPSLIGRVSRGIDSNIIQGLGTVISTKKVKSIIRDNDIDGDLNVDGSAQFKNGLILKESATVPGGAPDAGNGKLWIKDDSPNKVFFTNDAGTDLDLTADVGGAYQLTGTGTTRIIPTGSALTNLADNAVILNGIDNSVTAGGVRAIVGGENCTASGSNNISLGINSTASGSNAIAIGVEGVASGQGSIVIAGWRCNALAANAHIFGGVRNDILDEGSDKACIFGGQFNEVKGNPVAATIIGGVGNDYLGGANSIIAAGEGNVLTAQNSGIIGGKFSTMTTGTAHGMCGGENNTVSAGTAAGTLAGSGNSTTATNSAMVGGSGNNLSVAATRSVVLGGSGIAGTAADTVYVPSLEVTVESGLMIKSPNGSLWRINVSDGGVLSTTAV